MKQNTPMEHEQTALPNPDPELPSGGAAPARGFYGKNSHVIEPLSPGLEPAAPAVGHAPSQIAAPSTPAAEAMSHAASGEAAPARPTHPGPASVYPIPAADRRPGEPAWPASVGNQAKEPRESAGGRARWVAVTLGVCIIALCGLTMLAWLFAVHSAQNFIIGGRFTPSTEGSMVLAACGILLGFGILLRRETARALYLYVAVFLLALTVYNTYTFQRDARVINLFNKNEAADVDRKIVQYQNSPMYVSQLKAEKAASSKAVSLFYRHALPLAAAYGASILPLIFLNLPRVKDAFDS